MSSNDEKTAELLDEISKFYIDPANTAQVFGRPASALEQYMFRIGANISRNVRNDSIPVVGLLFGLVTNGIQSFSSDQFFADDYAMESAKKSVWLSLKTAIQGSKLLVRDALTLVPVNGTPGLEKWCSSDSPVLDQDAANFVVKVADARSWLDGIGVPVPPWLTTTGASRDAEFKQKKASPPDFCIAFEELINEISCRATNKGIQFSRWEMPGRKIDLQEIANRLDPRLKFTKSTFGTYSKGLCAFKKGARETDFYRALFHDLI